MIVGIVGLQLIFHSFLRRRGIVDLLSPLRENAEIHIAIRQEEPMRAEVRETASDTKLGQTSKIRQKLDWKIA